VALDESERRTGEFGAIALDVGKEVGSPFDQSQLHSRVLNERRRRSARAQQMGSSTNEGGRGRWTHRVNGIHTLPASVPLRLHPVSVEIGEQPVHVLGSCRVPIPFLHIVL
jgi:hypothetical protein